MTASNIPPWPTAVTPNVDPVTGLTPAQRSTLDDLSLRTTPAGGATVDTFYTALLTATPEQLRNATTPGEIRRHLATQAVLDFHTDPAIAARITHAGGLDTVLTHLRDRTEATTGTGALVPDLTARHYNIPITIIDANGDPMPGTGRPRHPTHNPFTPPPSPSPTPANHKPPPAPVTPALVAAAPPAAATTISSPPPPTITSTPSSTRTAAAQVGTAAAHARRAGTRLRSATAADGPPAPAAGQTPCSAPFPWSKPQRAPPPARTRSRPPS